MVLFLSKMQIIYSALPYSSYLNSMEFVLLGLFQDCINDCFFDDFVEVLQHLIQKLLLEFDSSSHGVESAKAFRVAVNQFAEMDLYFLLLSLKRSLINI